jgi:hypothetical protein
MVGRLVEQQQVGILRQRAGDRGALPLAAAELAGEAVGLVGDPDAVEQGQRLRLSLIAPHFPHAHWSQRDVPENRQVGEQVKTLENHAHLAPYGIEMLDIVVEFDSVDDDLAAVMGFESVQCAQKSRFS